jgi:predicted alpha/beta hydrolase family esterase
VEALDRAIADIEGPVVLAAHSAGCLMVAHWAQRHSRPIKAALLAAPATSRRRCPRGYPTLEALKANGWIPIRASPCRSAGVRRGQHQMTLSPLSIWTATLAR